MVVIRRLSTDILPGDFLLVQRTQTESSSNLAVCQVLNVVLPQNLEVVWWFPPVAAPPLCPITFENLHRCRAREVSQGTSSIIDQDNVIEIAFVFSVEFLEYYWVDFAGMTHVFFTRKENHQPFSTTVVESYPHRIWFGILSIQDKVRKLLSCKRQQQLCQKAATTTISLEFWSYISRRLSNFVISSPLEKSVTRVQNFSDLSMKSTSTIRTYSVIRIMSAPGIAAAREVFGYTFGVGSRNLPPRKGTLRKVLEHGNIVNVVNVHTAQTNEEFKEKVAHQRIDFVFEEFSRTLSIWIKYSDVLAESGIDAEVLHFPRPLPQPETIQPPARSRRRARAIAIGTSFVHNGKLFIVARSDGLVVTATCVVSVEELTMSNEEVSQIIWSNIG
jgi:hypothetical protein